MSQDTEHAVSTLLKSNTVRQLGNSPVKHTHGTNTIDHALGRLPCRLCTEPFELTRIANV
jgi:hypothetical protein